jgi:hypothetical protein
MDRDLSLKFIGDGEREVEDGEKEVEELSY